MNKLNFRNLKNLILIKKEIIMFIFLSFLLYFIFFKNIFSSQFNFWNSDASIKMFPVRVFLYEKLSNFEFPLWTERVFLGYPLYLDIENGILNPINLLSIFLFGPVWSLKFLHLGTYLLGSLCIFNFIKDNFKNYHLAGGLLSVLAFYFSFFQINHLIHMNMVLVAMLLPIHIYLLNKYYESKRIKYLIIQVLFFTYGVLWGQPQINFFNLAITLIFATYLNLKFSLKYIIVVVFCTFCLSLIQLYPSFYSFVETGRASGEFKYWEFTNSPTIFLNYIFPYSLGYYQNYRGSEISGAFSIVETYGYLGITFFVIFIFYLLYGSKDKFYKFVVYSFYFYLLITFIGNFFEMKIPFYNDFRYWTRGIFFISFLFLFCINFFLNLNLKELKIDFKNLLIILFIFIITLFFESKDFINFLITNNFVYLKKIDILIWISLIFLTIFIIFLYLKKMISIQIFSIIFLLIATFDLRYFSSDLIPMRISRYKSEANFKTPLGCEFKRCLLENQNYNGYEFLLFNTYSPFGYSVFIDKNYVEYFENNFQTDLYQSPRSESIRSNLDVKLLENIGFQKIILANGLTYNLPKNDFWLTNEINLYKFILNKEGHYVFEFESQDEHEIKLNLKYNSNFYVYINQKKSELIKEGIFSKIKVEKGRNIVEIVYYPNDILKGFLIGISLISIFVIFLLSVKFKIINK